MEVLLIERVCDITLAEFIQHFHFARSFSYTFISSKNEGKLYTSWVRNSGVNVTGIQDHFVLPLHLTKACVTVILVV